jgi:HD-GYP domain-containing protein (c-di-GMP phosphodiesterase class II)
MVDDVYTSDLYNFNGPKEYDKLTGYRTRSMMVIPLTAISEEEEADVLGVIQLMNAIDPKTNETKGYSDVSPVIPALANIAANTLANLIHLGEIKMLFNAFATAMAHTIDERSSYNSNHTLSVVDLCVKFTEYLSVRFAEGHNLFFDEKRRDEVAMAAVLHDIGKIITPVSIMDKNDRLGERLEIVRHRFEVKKLQLENDMLREKITPAEFEKQTDELKAAKNLVEEAVIPSRHTPERLVEIENLSRFTFTDFEGNTAKLLDEYDIEALSIKAGTLTDRERAIMQEHAVLTGRILENAAFSKYYKNVLSWARSHHEFMDGSGYPDALKGEQIPIEVRILTIVDIFEALTAKDRPYKKSISTDVALRILDDMAKHGKIDNEILALFKESRVWVAS